jgi:cell division protein FtsN
VAAPAKAPAAEDFSVQVGSFGSSEQAERLRTNLTQKGYPARVQLSSVPGKGLRYRVRVGSYTERAAADQTAHHLTAQEQVPAIVAGKD